MKPQATVLTIAAFLALPGIALAANTITFNGEVTDQTCSAVVDGRTDPTVILDSVPVSTLTGTVGKPAGETSFTLQLTNCAAPATGTDEHFAVMFQAVNPTTTGNLTNTAASGATGVALQLLEAPGGPPVNLASGAAVTAGDIVLAGGETSTSYFPTVEVTLERASLPPRRAG
ncbi:TPA: type 1 fimbrial protein [Pseudomonas aeruginosa]|nr:type 1 fimbrial protein [Pseudomonas aeruginosa]